MPGGNLTASSHEDLYLRLAKDQNTHFLFLYSLVDLHVQSGSDVSAVV